MRWRESWQEGGNKRNELVITNALDKLEYPNNQILGILVNI